MPLLLVILTLLLSPLSYSDILGVGWMGDRVFLKAFVFCLSVTFLPFWAGGWVVVVRQASLLFSSSPLQASHLSLNSSHLSLLLSHLSYSDRAELFAAANSTTTYSPLERYNAVASHACLPPAHLPCGNLCLAGTYTYAYCFLPVCFKTVLPACLLPICLWVA